MAEASYILAIGEGNTMSMHDSNIYGKDMVKVLDDAYQHMVNMDAAADFHGYRDAKRNARAERAAARYERLKAQARRMKMREIEVVPVADREAAEIDAYIDYRADMLAWEIEARRDR